MNKTETIATKLRWNILRVATANNKGHIAPSLSCLDILTVLYYEIINRDIDTVILSKGHGCYGLYAIQSDLGIIPKSQWEGFQLDGCLTGYGSLGHGLPIAVGMAYGNKLYMERTDFVPDDQWNHIPIQVDYPKNGHIYCITGDGEWEEGSMWEALSFAYHHKLSNLTIIVDANRLQAMDKVDNILYQNLYSRFEGFGFSPFIINGHKHREIKSILKRKFGVPILADYPKIIIANTIKGKGIKCMENNPKFHYRIPTAEELK